MKTVKQVNNIKFTEREKDTIITSQSELPQDILKYAKKDSISSDLKKCIVDNKHLKKIIDKELENKEITKAINSFKRLSTRQLWNKFHDLGELMYRCETATNWEDVKHFYEIAEKQRLEIAELLRSRGEKININQI